MHSVTSVLISNNLIAHRRDVATVDFRYLINGLIKDNQPVTSFYAAKARIVNRTPALKIKTAAIVSSQRALRQVLKSQSIDFINSGQLAVRQDDPHTGRGSRKWYLKEKGVDVRIAVDMIQQSSRVETIYLASSDTDLLPAIKAARANDCKVAYVGFENSLIESIKDNTDETLAMQDREVIKAFKRLNA